MQSRICFVRCLGIGLREPWLCVHCWGGKGTKKEQGYNSHFSSASSLSTIKLHLWRMNSLEHPGDITLPFWAATGALGSDSSLKPRNSEKRQASVVLGTGVLQQSSHALSVIETKPEPSPGVRGPGAIRESQQRSEMWRFCHEPVEGPGRPEGPSKWRSTATGSSASCETDLENVNCHTNITLL